MGMLDIHGRELLKKIAEQPDKCRHFTQRQMSVETGIQESIISEVLRQARNKGLLVRGMGRRRTLEVTEKGLEWMVTAPPDDRIERVVTKSKRRRVLVACLRRGFWQKDLAIEAAVSTRHLSILLRWLDGKKHIYRSNMGWKTSPAGRDWLQSIGVETNPEPKTRRCLMCDEVAAKGRWYCAYHCDFRQTLFRTQNDGSYCPSGGGMSM